ncbi:MULTISPECIES: ribokinase [Dickeya]|uniref:Ribokinase n=1 Tax=Dickeya oryzae TaxID=1240404 RepID=A0AB39ICW3_9GAMM|nr:MULTISPECIES: ribokinase [Dickeya]AJC64987.1 RbsK [Dickeya zeae EC1]MBP2848220.1 ribokinase [Dickeya oryzae]MCA6994224.1 ribokinase [Dickeya oryzae]QIZ45792.1 ribokinase [Dickeya zeae]UPT57518.1 ribokinase [Dickeya zeae]
MKGKVCVFGSFNLDIVSHMQRFPAPGESLIAQHSMMGPGGKGANQAMAAMRAGARVHYIGKVGRDDFGSYARRHLEHSGFDAITLFTCKEKPTGNALIYVAGDDAENMISVYPGANLTVTAAEVARCRPTVAAADILLMQLENNLNAIQRMMDTAREAGTYVIVNPAPWQKVSNAFLRHVDLLTPNSTEATQLTGVAVSDWESAERAAEVLHDKGVAKLMITLGTQGALLSTGDSLARIPVFPAQPKDTTGAGDAFNGALAARLAAGETLAEAALFASAYAAVCVEREGAANAMPLYADAQARLQAWPTKRIEWLRGDASASGRVITGTESGIAETP